MHKIFSLASMHNLLKRIKRCDNFQNIYRPCLDHGHDEHVEDLDGVAEHGQPAVHLHDAAVVPGEHLRGTVHGGCLHMVLMERVQRNLKHNI